MIDNINNNIRSEHIDTIMFHLYRYYPNETTINFCVHLFPEGDFFHAIFYTIKDNDMFFYKDCYFKRKGYTKKNLIQNIENILIHDVSYKKE